LGLILGHLYLAEIALWLIVHFVCLLAGFVIHEAAHAYAGRRCQGITAFRVESTIFRFSLSPVGFLFGWQIALTALAGPLAAALVGCLLFVAAPALSLHYWFWLHLVFLTPVFGDGRSLIVGLRSPNARRQLHAVNSGRA
jgi:hypothetical protein